MFKKDIDFNKSFKPVAIIYAAVIIIGILVSVIFGVKLDINFKGGTVITYNYIVDEANEAGVTVYHLQVAENDVGRVIGKQGRIAKAIRTVMRAAANRTGALVAVEID